MAIFKIINIQQLDQKYVCVDGYVLWKYQGTIDDRLYSGTVLQQIGHPAECRSVIRHDAINRVNVNINTPAFKQVSNAISEAINESV
jgi:hypothetical protein